MSNPERKWKRQPNQHPMRDSDYELSVKASELLGLIKRYQYKYNVTNFQYACLLGISLRNTIKRINELVQKNRVEIYPPGRKLGRGKANRYVLKQFDPSLLEPTQSLELDGPTHIE